MAERGIRMKKAFLQFNGSKISTPQIRGSIVALDDIAVIVENEDGRSCKVYLKFGLPLDVAVSLEGVQKMLEGFSCELSSTLP